MDTIRRIKKISIAGLMMLVLLVTGCGSLQDETEFRNYQENNDIPVFADSEHQSFQQLFGDATYNDLKNLLQDILDNLQSAARYGDITTEDAMFIRGVLGRASEVVDNLEYNSNNVQKSLYDLFIMAHDNNVGDLLTNLFSALAVDGAESCMLENGQDNPKCNMLTETLQPLLEYILFEMDFGNFNGFSLAVPDTSEGVEITKEDISRLTQALGHIVNPKGPYAEIYTQAQALYALAKEREALLETRPTVGNTKALANELIATAKWAMETLGDAQGKVDADIDTQSLLNAIKNAVTGVVDAYKADGELNTDAVKNAMINMWFDLRPESTLDIRAIMDAVIEVWEEQNPVLIGDTNDLVYAVGRLLSDDTRPGYDGWNWTNQPGMTDAERALLCVQDILNPVIQSRESLHAFLLNALTGVSRLEGADSINGIVQGLSSVTQEDMKDIDTALYKYMIQNNINGEIRGTDDVNISVLRGVFYLLTVLYNISDMIEGPVTSTLLSTLIGFEEGTESYPDIPNENIVEWALGLIIVGMYEYPEDYNYLPGYPNPLEGLDWVFYEQNINLLHIIPFNGLYGVLKILLEHEMLLNLVNLAAGAITEPLPALYEFTGGDGTMYSTGDRHKLFAILAPILKHYWDQGRLLDFVDMATYINEIDPMEYKTLAYAGSNATFRAGTEQANRLGHVLENIEGRYGRGLLYYGFRGDSEADDNHAGDPIDPILDIMVRVLKKLNATPYAEGETLLEYLTATGTSANYDGPTPEELVNRLFEPDEFGETTMDKIYDFLVDNHNDLAILAKAAGEVIVALHTDVGYDDGTVFDLSMIFDILANGRVLDAARDALLSNNEARDAFGRFILVGIDSLGLLDDKDVIVDDGVNYLTGKDIKDRLAMILDIGMRILGGVIDDFQVLVPYVEDIWNTFNSVVKDEKMTEDEKVAAILVPVRAMLNSPDIKSAAQHAVRVVLEEADIFGFTNEDFISTAQALVGALFDNADTLVDDVEAILPNILKQLVKMDLPTDTDNIDINGIMDILKKIATTVMNEIGKENSVLVEKGKIILFKLLYIKDGKYNTDGVFTDSTGLFEMIEALLTGENRTYDLMTVINFLNEATEKDALANFLSEGSVKQSDFLRELQEEEDVKLFLSMRLIRAVLTPYDGRPSIAEMLFKVLHIHRIENGKLETLDVNLLIKDAAEIVYELNIDPETNPRFYKVVRDLLRLAAEMGTN